MPDDPITTEVVAADTAALAANQAERAAAAAESAVANAEIASNAAAANAAEAAALSVQQSEQRLAEWQAHQETLHSATSQRLTKHEETTQAALSQMAQSLSLIQEQLGRRRASPESPAPSLSGGERPEPKAEPPEEEKPPARKRAHRWT